MQHVELVVKLSQMTKRSSLLHEDAGIFEEVLPSQPSDTAVRCVLERGICFVKSHAPLSPSFSLPRTSRCAGSNTINGRCRRPSSPSRRHSTACSVRTALHCPCPALPVLAGPVSVSVPGQPSLACVGLLAFACHWPAPACREFISRGSSHCWARVPRRLRQQLPA